MGAEFSRLLVSEGTRAELYVLDWPDREGPARPIQLIEDMTERRTLASASLSPNGAWAVVVVQDAPSLYRYYRLAL